jgi:hypothetical protein
MASRELERIRNAILDHRYLLTEHAYEEMDDDHLDALDMEAAVLSGEVDRVLTADPRGTRYVVIGTATDQETPVGVVMRFVEHDQLLVIAVYEIKWGAACTTSPANTATGWCASGGLIGRRYGTRGAL